MFCIVCVQTLMSKLSLQMFLKIHKPYLILWYGLLCLKKKGICFILFYFFHIQAYWKLNLFWKCTAGLSSVVSLYIQRLYLDNQTKYHENIFWRSLQNCLLTVVPLCIEKLLYMLKVCLCVSSCLRTTDLLWRSAWGLLRTWMKSPRTCWRWCKHTWSLGNLTAWWDVLSMKWFYWYW